MNVAGFPAASSSKRRWATENQPTIRQWLWGCCNCGKSGPLTSFIEFCDECQHERCFHCPWERVKINLHETLFDDDLKSRQGLAPACSNADATLNDAREALSSLNNSTSGLNWPLIQSSGIERKDEPPDEVQNRELNPKRRRKKRAASKSRSESRKGFACHFCKRDPQRYNPWTGDHRYLKCLYPNPHDWRHIR